MTVKPPVELIVAQMDEVEVRAIKALYRGDADQHQQRLALSVVINKLCRSQDLLYVPGNQEASVFLNGRAFVGLQLLRILKLPVGTLVIPTAEGTSNG